MRGTTPISVSFPFLRSCRTYSMTFQCGIIGVVSQWYSCSSVSPVCAILCSAEPANGNGCTDVSVSFSYSVDCRSSPNSLVMRHLLKSTVVSCLVSLPIFWPTRPSLAVVLIILAASRRSAVAHQLCDPRDTVSSSCSVRAGSRSQSVLAETRDALST